VSETGFLVSDLLKRKEENRLRRLVNIHSSASNGHPPESGVRKGRKGKKKKEREEGGKAWSPMPSPSARERMALLYAGVGEKIGKRKRKKGERECCGGAHFSPHKERASRVKDMGKMGGRKEKGKGGGKQDLASDGVIYDYFHN